MAASPTAAGCRCLPVHQTAGEIVDERVEAAVGAGQCQSHGVHGLGQSCQAAVWQQPNMRERVAQQVDVIGHKAEQEDCKHPVDECEGVTATAELTAAAQPLLPKHTQHSAVAAEQEGCGQQEATLDKGQRQQDEGAMLLGGGFEQARLVLLSCRQPQYGQSNTDYQHQAPDPPAHPLSHPSPAERRPEWMHHSKVAVHCDAQQEEDSAVQADILEHKGEVAVGGAGGPAGAGWAQRFSLLVVVIDPERQRDNEGKVGRRQAHHVDGGAAPFVRSRTESAQSQAVGDQSYQEDHAVAHLVEGEAVTRVYGAVGRLHRLLGHVPQIHNPEETLPCWEQVEMGSCLKSSLLGLVVAEVRSIDC